VVRSAEGMVKLALQRAKRLAVQDRLEWPSRDDAVYKALTGQRLSMAEFTGLDDVSVLHCFKLWTRAEDATLGALCRGVLFRRLFKTIDLSHVTDEAEFQSRRAAAIAAVVAAGGDPGYDLFVDEPSDTAYADQEEEGCPMGHGIRVCDPSGRVTELSAISPIPAALHRRLLFRRLHMTPQLKEIVQRALLDPGP